MIQRYLLADEPEWATVLAAITDVADAAGIDYLIGEPDAPGCGIGTAAISEMAAQTFAGQPVTAIVVTVQQANRPSWRALERSGFTRVWAGEFDSPDPSDAGPEHVYVIER
jgi:aminoglycoside 6'-N-acetyltransferase